MPPKKPVVVKKPAVKKIVKRSAASTTSTKNTTKKASAAKKRKSSIPANVDFAPDSDMGRAWEEIRKGGESRTDVMYRVREALGDSTTRSGNPKPVPTIMNHVMRRARAAGYEVVQSWSLRLNPDLVPPATDKPTTKKTAKKAAFPRASEILKDAKKRVVKKPAAKKVMRKKP